MRFEARKNLGGMRMFRLRNINPMARAIGTVGAVAALAGGITFANLTTPTVALTPNNLVTATAALAIGAGTTCPGGDTTATPGFTTSTPLVPGGPAVTTKFCLDNKGNIPLTVSSSIPTLPTGTAAGNTSLTIACTTEGTLSVANSTLSSWSGGAFPVQLPAGSQDNCTASAKLSSSYTGKGGETIPSFDIDFVGNQ